MNEGPAALIPDSGQQRFHLRAHIRGEGNQGSARVSAIVAVEVAARFDAIQAQFPRNALAGSDNSFLLLGGQFQVTVLICEINLSAGLRRARGKGQNASARSRLKRLQERSRRATENLESDLFRARFDGRRWR